MDVLDPWDIGLHSCALAGHRHKCGGGWHRHHVLSRHLLRNNKEAKRYCEKIHKDIFYAMVCGNANAALKLADCPWARAVILKRKIERFGYGYVQDVWNNIPGKLSYPTLEAVLYFLPDIEI